MTCSACPLPECTGDCERSKRWEAIRDRYRKPEPIENHRLAFWIGGIAGTLIAIFAAVQP